MFLHLRKMNKEKRLKQFHKIPSIGKAYSLDLWNIGIKSIEQLSGQNPNFLYEKLNTLTGVRHDICMLYTFRCSNYHATEQNHDELKLNWWYWKNKTYNEN